MAETKAQKANRYVQERRLRVTRVDGALIVAWCRGDSGRDYALGHDPTARGGEGEWRCTCSASREFHRTCSHLLALQLVTVVT